MSMFDAFCIFLECSGSSRNGLSPAYVALCEWILQLSLDLVKPKLPGVVRDPATSCFMTSRGKKPPRNLSNLLHLEERFLYFMKRICKARIWNDCGGDLFRRFRNQAQGFMDDIAILCDERCIHFPIVVFLLHNSHIWQKQTR